MSSIKSLHKERGQSLMEVLIALAIGSIFVVGAVMVIVVSIRVSIQSEDAQAASQLNQELADQLDIFSADNWHNVDSLTLGTSSIYSLSESGSFFATNSGTQSLIIGSTSYERWFTLEEVQRDGDNQIVASSGTIDPSTLKATISTKWIQQNGDEEEQSMSRFLTRNGSRVFNVDDWVGGPGQEGPITIVNTEFTSSENIYYATSGQITISTFNTSSSSSTGNIDEVDRWAWNDIIGWIDFKETGTVIVSSSIIQGYASSSVGEIALDCATSPIPDCATSSYQVNNDGNGNLSGWAWNDIIGWISFYGSAAPSTYAVVINPNTGVFSGWAWNDIIGWISFNCSNTASCGSVDYKLVTSWGNTVINATLKSSIFDTEKVGGAAFNNLMWQGDQPAGTVVKFQVASSNSPSGPWTYMGLDGTGSSYYQPAGPDIQTPIIRANHNNHRYIRYEATLESNLSKTQGPTVDNIIIGWSP